MALEVREDHPAYLLTGSLLLLLIEEPPKNETWNLCSPPKEIAQFSKSLPGRKFLKSGE